MSIAEKRFLKALLNLCIDHGFKLEGLGVENWVGIKPLDKNIPSAILCGLQYERVMIDTYMEISKVANMLNEEEREKLGDYATNIFVWLQDD